MYRYVPTQVDRSPTNLGTPPMDLALGPEGQGGVGARHGQGLTDRRVARTRHQLPLASAMRPSPLGLSISICFPDPSM